MTAKILVAEDDKGMLNVYKRLFANTEYSISLASSFSEASGLLASNHYDLLITDLLLQDGLGTELIKMFEQKRSGARSLLVTGAAVRPERGELSYEYFEKPFKVEVFMSAVKRALA